MRWCISPLKGICCNLFELASRAWSCRGQQSSSWIFCEWWRRGRCGELFDGISTKMMTGKMLCQDLWWQVLIRINVFIVLKPILYDDNLQHDAMSLPVASCSGTERCMRRRGNCKVEILGLLDQINVRLFLRQSDRRTMANHRIPRNSPDTGERTRETCVAWYFMICYASLGAFAWGLLTCVSVADLAYIF